MSYYLGEPGGVPKDPEPGADRRKFKRRYIQFAAHYRFNAEGVLSDWKTSSVGNISAGGLFMIFGEDLHVGREIELELDIPDTGRIIKVKAVIRRIKEVVPGAMVECGLEFVNLAPEDRAFIDKFANEQPPETPPETEKP